MTTVTIHGTGYYMDDYLFRGKYRATTARLRTWDYAKEGVYFVTMCTKFRFPWFGKLNGNGIDLSHAGLVIAERMIQIPRIYQNLVGLDEWCVMPDHVHAIVVIKNVNAGGDAIRWRLYGDGRKTITLATVVGGFKRSCSALIRVNDSDFVWQSRYYDRIIRDENELNAVRQYIRNNHFKNISILNVNNLR